DPRAEGSQARAAVVQVVDDVSAGRERPGRQPPDPFEHRPVGVLQHAGEDVWAQMRLVDVDSDGEDSLLLRRLEGARAARAGDPDDDGGTLRDMAEGDRLALARMEEVARIGVQRPDPRHRGSGSGLEAGDEVVDRRELEAADGADGVLAPASSDEGRQVP